jgi:hypothetical protein
LDDLEDDLQNNTEGHTKDTTLKTYREEQFSFPQMYLCAGMRKLASKCPH